jgi:hypothetical protein
VVCLSVIVKPPKRRRPRPDLGCCATERNMDTSGQHYPHDGLASVPNKTEGKVRHRAGLYATLWLLNCLVEGLACFLISKETRDSSLTSLNL